MVPASGNIRRDFLSDVQSIVEGKNIFVARYALDKIPASMFEASSGLQEWLLHVFASASYPMQMALLDKFEELPLTIQVTTALARHLARTNEEQFERILQLLSKQEELHNDAIREMTRTLASAERSRAVRMYQMLEGMDIRDPEVRKQLKKHKKIN